MTARATPRIWFRYVDERRGVETIRAYLSDGRVVAYDGAAWWEVCPSGTVAPGALCEVLAQAHITDGDDLRPAAEHRGTDTAVLEVGWRGASGTTGRVTNYVYPVRNHPAMQDLERKLDALEAGARAGADDMPPDIDPDWDDPDGLVAPVLGSAIRRAQPG